MVAVSTEGVGIVRDASLGARFSSHRPEPCVRCSASRRCVCRREEDVGVRVRLSRAVRDARLARIVNEHVPEPLPS
jgi:hypothetical protein